MGGVCSGNWYRFDKKNTTGECHSVDARYLHREGLLTPGRWFSLRWSRAGKETGSIGGMVEGNSGDRPERVILSYRHRSGSERRMGRRQGIGAPGVDAVQLRRGAALVCLSRRGLRPERSRF